MAGTKAGGIKAAATNKAKYGDRFYAHIGHKGGKNGHTGGFASMTHERVAECGRKGGAISKRGPANDVTIRKAEERKRLRAEIRALEAEEDWND